MAQREGPAWFWHATHEWRWPRVDRSGLWPVITIGKWTVEVLPASIAGRVTDVLNTLRGTGNG